MDELDREIIAELRENSKISMKELGAKVNLTGQAASNRVRKLEDDNVITGYTIDVNQEALECKVHVFISIYTHKVNHSSYIEFINEEKIYVMNNYKVLGDPCYHLECRFPNNNELNAFLERLNKHANYKVLMTI